MAIPKIQTKEEYLREEAKRDTQEATFQALFAMVGATNTLSRKPSYNDADEVAGKAYKDIRNMDFSEMAEYIDSLVQIAEHWQEYAEHYFEELKSRGAKFDPVDGYVLEADTEVITVASSSPDKHTKGKKNTKKRPQVGKQ